MGCCCCSFQDSEKRFLEFAESTRAGGQREAGLETLSHTRASLASGRDEQQTENGVWSAEAAVKKDAAEQRAAADKHATGGPSVPSGPERCEPMGGSSAPSRHDGVDDVSAKELFNVTLKKFIIPVLRRGVERILRVSLESESGLHIGLMDDTWALCVGAGMAERLRTSGSGLQNEPLISTFQVEVSAACVVNKNDDDVLKHGLAEFCTLMPPELHHVADEVLTLDVDFDLELHFGELIHKKIFRLRSQKRFVPDFGAAFGVKFIKLQRCRTRVWWSFTEQKLMIAFRVAPTVVWEIDIRVMNVGLPDWLEDGVLRMGVERLLAGFDLRNPLMVPLDGQEQLDRAAAEKARLAAEAAVAAAMQTARAAKAANDAASHFNLAAAKATVATNEVPTMYMSAWESFAASLTAAAAAESAQAKLKAAAKSSRESARLAAAVSHDAHSRVVSTLAQGAREVHVSTLTEHIVNNGRGRDESERLSRVSSHASSLNLSTQSLGNRMPPAVGSSSSFGAGERNYPRGAGRTFAERNSASDARGYEREVAHTQRSAFEGQCGRATISRECSVTSVTSVSSLGTSICAAEPNAATPGQPPSAPMVARSRTAPTFGRSRSGVQMLSDHWRFLQAAARRPKRMKND